jgi:colanic acid biosynthesis glycosyl transferase WcaI
LRLLIHTINYRPELTGIGKYTGEMCEWLASRGHTVTVVAPPPYYPNWRIAGPHKQWRYASSTLDKVFVRRAPIWIPKRPGGIARVLYALSFAISSFPLLLREAFRADVVFVIEPSFLNSPLAYVAARLARARAWLHIQDFEIDLAYDLGQFRHGRRIARFLESLISRRFDVVSSISAAMLRRAKAKGVSPEKMFLFPNFFDDSAIYPTQCSSLLRERLGIKSGSIVALYSGSLGAKQGIEMILESAKLLAGSNIHFVICGDGVSREALRASARGAQNITFLPLQPAEDLNTLLNAADLHLLPQRPGAAPSVLPSKLIGMLASGRPIVAMAGADSEIAELAEGCSICVDPGDTVGFADAIRRMASDESGRRRMGQKARNRALSRFRQDNILSLVEARMIATSKNIELPRAVPDLLAAVSDSAENS